MTDHDQAAITVRMEHCRALGYCAAGVRGWCAAHGIDYLVFVREGLPLAAVLALEDAMGARAAELAVREATEQAVAGRAP